ncbi:MAG TPA: hypothetical protein VHQ01_12175, partial [Pyrinomonadaceae bacterium]|nr:hypothetical protein [Pyrinomonadaceae bacterium]
VAGAPSFLEKNKQLIPYLTKYGLLVLVAILLLFFVIRPAKKALRAASIQAEEQRQLMASIEEERRQAAAPRQLGDSSHANMAEMSRSSEMEGQMNPYNEPAFLPERERVEAIRKQIASQTLTDTDTVVSTMRGWLRESA